VTERELLDAARDGDGDAFRHLVETHRVALLAHCYRMLGSVADAEDALQDTFLHAWRGLSGFDGRCALRRWLYRIATNACLDAIARRPKRIVPIDYRRRDGAAQGTLPAVAAWLEPSADEALNLEDGSAAPEVRYEQREAVQLAFVMALRHLPPRQRVVLILREVLGFSAEEVSRSLGTTVISVNSALQRARKAVNERVPETSQQAKLRAPGDASIHEITERFVDAVDRGDVGAIVALLIEDANVTQAPYPRQTAVRPRIRGLRTASLSRSGLPSELAA
jgi:RNA polymerase sigma-70 factor (ECF subfamily)